MTAPDQTYGKQTAQQQSQHILPVAAPEVAGPGGAAGAGGPGAGAQPQIQVPTPGPGPAPGQLAWTQQPTARPNEPLMAGAPGSGLGALGALGRLAQAQQNEQGTTRQLLAHLASQPGASDIVKQLATTAGATVAG